MIGPRGFNEGLKQSIAQRPGQRHKAAMTDPTYERAVELLEAELGDELVALSIEDGQCFGFNAVATSVWRALDQPRTYAEIEAALLDEYEVSRDECASELHALLGDLVDMKLVRARNGGTDSA
jgi:hypothetical protein